MDIYRFNVEANMMEVQEIDFDEFDKYMQREGWATTELGALMSAVRRLHDRIVELEEGKA